MCRKNIGPEKYKVTLNIENLETKVSNTVTLSDFSTLELFNGLGIEGINGSLEFQMLMDTDRLLQEYLEDLHIRLSDMNALIFDTESSAIRGVV